MTVLLIDQGGNVCEWEIPTLVAQLLVPLQFPMTTRIDEAPRMTRNLAVFELTGEASFPRVYRWVRNEF